MRFAKRVSIQHKLIALMVAVLGLSVLVLVQTGGALIVADKSTYIYDHALTRLEAVAALLESRVERLRAVAEAASQALSSPLAEAEKARIGATFRTQAAKLGARGLWLLRPAGPAQFQIPIILGETGPGMEELFSRLGWTPEALAKRPILVGANAPEGLPIAGSFDPATVGSGAFFTLLSIPAEVLESDEKALAVFIADHRGQIAAEKKGGLDSPAASSVAEWASSLAAEQLASGVVNLKSGGREFIASYRRVLGDQAIVIATLPRDLAFTAARELAKRSLNVGLAIALIAVGIGLLLARPVIRKIEQLWLATQRVGEGDFSVRVDEKASMPDELTALASSFNIMSNQIQELIRQTADKARMEKELETAREVQNRFLPTTSVQTVPFRLAGRCRSATECAGDWWQFVRLGDLLVVLVGDATGHGVSAALITAAVHNAFHSVIRRYQGPNPPQLSFQLMLDELNASVWAAAGGSTYVTLNLSVIDLRLGQVHWVSAGHPPPYLVTQVGGQPQVKSMLIETPTQPLGMEAQITAKTATLQLAAGDLIVWYTDGLFEGHKLDEKRYPKRRFLAELDSHRQRSPTHPEQIATEILTEALRPLGPGEAPEDDITVVVGVVPPDAIFPASMI